MGRDGNGKEVVGMGGNGNQILFLHTSIPYDTIRDTETLA